jgi:hypothetical protein
VVGDNLYSSCAGLTRASITFARNHLHKKMDHRVAARSLSSGGALRRPVGAGPVMTTEIGAAPVLLNDLVIQIVPVWVHRDNEVDLPFPGPVLDILFWLNGRQSGAVFFEIDQPSYPIALGKSADQFIAVLKIHRMRSRVTPT